MERELRKASSKTGFLCCGHLRQHRVQPFSYSNGERYLVEIRPKRVLYIQHINPQPRDPHFEKEIHMQRMYRRSGASANGPLTIPRRKTGETKTFSSREIPPTNMLNSVQRFSGESLIISQMQDKAEVSGPSSASNVYLASHSDTSLQLQGGVCVQDIPSSRCVPGLLKMQSFATDTSQNSTPSRPHIQQKDAQSELEVHTEGKLETSFVNNKMALHHHSIVLFFLHGVGGSSNVWESQMYYFAKEGYEIVAPDLIGHGFSCTPQDPQAYHFKEIGIDLEEIFDKYCKKKNVIIGHSYGCSFACLLARQRARLVHNLVLISGGDPSPLAPQPGIFRLPTSLLCCIKPCLNCGFQKNAFHKAHKMAKVRQEAFSIPTYVLQHTMNGQDWPDGDEIFHQWLICPVLLIYGEKDKLVSLDEEKATAQAIFDSHLEVIKDAGHMVMMEASGEVNRLIHNFLLEHSRNANNPLVLGTLTNSP